MPWCPKCKLEYVDGIKICPDCKSEMVDSLDKVNALDVLQSFDNTDNDGAINLNAIMNAGLDEDDAEAAREKAAILAELRQAMDGPKYQSVEDMYIENKSGAGVLLVCGVIGIVALILNGIGVLHIPLSGFSLVLMNVVMGCLFFVFLLSGIRSIIRMNQLKDKVSEEKNLIDEVTKFVKANKAAGLYTISSKEGFELEYLAMCDKVIADINANFPNAAAGFANYFSDKYLGDILDED